MMLRSRAEEAAPQRTLDRFFQTRWLFYFDSEMEELTQILRSNRMFEWARTPRLYFILREVGRQDLISTLVTRGIDDHSLPVEKPQLLDALANAPYQLIESFITFQNRVIPHDLNVYQTQLDAFFEPNRDSMTKPLRDEEFSEIGRLLRLCGDEKAAASPKLYFVLRSIGEADGLAKFQAKRLNDIWLPFPRRSLQLGLLPSKDVIDKFLQTQERVGSNRWTENVHMNFCDDDNVFLETRRELGAGLTGAVDHVYCPSVQRHYARKFILRTPDGMRFFANEIEILKTVSHRHCVSLVASYTDPHYLAIISEPVADMNLAAFLEATPIPLDRKKLLDSAFGCLSVAIHYLHSRSIRHKDIKPQNILVSANNLLLADFGLSAEITDTASTTMAKTLRYCSPEVEEGQPRGLPSDIWSLGCVFLEILAVLCSKTVGDLKLFFRKNGTKKINYYENMSAVAIWLRDECLAQTLQEFGQMALIVKDLTGKILVENPELRPTAESLVAKLSTGFVSSPKSYGQCCEAEFLKWKVDEIAVLGNTESLSSSKDGSSADVSESLPTENIVSHRTPDALSPKPTLPSPANNNQWLETWHERPHLPSETSSESEEPGSPQWRKRRPYKARNADDRTDAISPANPGIPRKRQGGKYPEKVDGVEREDSASDRSRQPPPRVTEIIPAIWVEIKGANNLPKLDESGASPHPYATLCIDGIAVGWTQTVIASVQPSWKKTFKLSGLQKSSVVKIEVFDSKLFEIARPIASWKTDVESLVQLSLTPYRTHELALTCRGILQPLGGSILLVNVRTTPEHPPTPPGLYWGN